MEKILSTEFTHPHYWELQASYHNIYLHKILQELQHINIYQAITYSIYINIILHSLAVQFMAF